MNGEVYLAEDARGWLVIHESEHGDSSGMEGPFPSYPTAVKAGRDLASRLDATFPAGEAGQVLPIAPGQRSDGDGGEV